jgi:glycosyltransferase involved in cell wall biosynthesis
MKIALVAQHTTPIDHRDTRQDPERARLRQLSRSLADDGHHVTLYCQKTDPSLPDRAKLGDGVRVEHIGPPGPDDAAGEWRPTERDLLALVPTFSGTLRDRLRHDRPDVVHAVRWTSGLAALAAARGLDLPIVQSFQSLGIAERRHLRVLPDAGAERMRLEPAIGRSVTAVLAGSTDEESDLARLGVPRRSIKIVPDGVDTIEFVPEGRIAARNGRPRLVTIVNLAPGDGIDTLLRAMEKVPGAELIVAGGPPRGELPGHSEHSRLSALAGSLGIADRVMFTGQVSRKALPPLLRSADLYVATCEYEPSAMLSLQAMACGTPVVAPAVGGHLDTVIDRTTGVLVPPGRPALLAQQIRQLLAHPMMLEAYSVAAADRAQSRFSWDRIAQETLAVYDRALDCATKAAA